MRNTQIFQGKFQIADLRPAIWSLENLRISRACGGLLSFWDEVLLKLSSCPTTALLLPCYYCGRHHRHHCHCCHCCHCYHCCLSVSVPVSAPATTPATAPATAPAALPATV